MRSMRLVVAALALAVALETVACGAAFKGQGEQLKEEVVQFNENVRWGRYRAAARWVPGKHRDQWVRQMERAGQVFRITDYEVTPVEITEDLAVMYVDVSYHRVNGVLLEKSRRKQTWKYVDSWTLASEKEIPIEDVLPDKMPEFMPEDEPLIPLSAGTAPPPPGSRAW